MISVWRGISYDLESAWLSSSNGDSFDCFKAADRIIIFFKSDFLLLVQERELIYRYFPVFIERNSMFCMVRGWLYFDIANKPSLLIFRCQKLSINAITVHSTIIFWIENHTVKRAARNLTKYHTSLKRAWYLPIHLFWIISHIIREYKLKILTHPSSLDVTNRFAL